MKYEYNDYIARDPYRQIDNERINKGWPALSKVQTNKSFTSNMPTLVYEGLAPAKIYDTQELAKEISKWQK